MIKFPKVHIATSVVNRILNIADGIPDAGSQAARIAPEPNVPDTATQSLILDETLASPIPGALPGIDQAPDPGATAGGATLLSTMLEPGKTG